MVMVKESHTCQQFSAWNSPGLDHLPLLQLDQCIRPSTCTANVALPEFSVSILPGSNAGHQDAVDAFLNLPALNCDIPHGTGNLYTKDSQCALLNRLGVSAKPSDTNTNCAQKRFLIFDQSGNKTRLFFSSSFSHHNQIVASKIPRANGSHEKPPARVGEHFAVIPIEEKWDENQLTDGEEEMLEDSEEIDALLYSDGEEEYEDDDGGGGENDEVTSTGHTPYIAEDVHRKHKFSEKLEEVASSDDLPKRRKLLDGGFEQPSSVGTESTTKLDRSYGDEDDVESSNAGMRNCSDDIYSSMREKKIKVREALKILESIIPGVKTKDPLNIIDKAITHLKLMKLEAESLGLGRSNLNGKLASFP